MNDSKKLLAEKRATFRLNMLAGFRPIPKVNIPEIPIERTLFPGTENDYWYKIETPEFTDTTCCIYELDTDGIFEPHFHDINTEQLILLTKGAKAEVVTTKEEFFIDFPSGCFFDKGMKHAVLNKSPFKIELLVIWKPRMIGGWNAEFLNKDN